MKSTLESLQHYNDGFMKNPPDHPAEQSGADPECPRCKGRGWVLVPNGEDDVDKDICDCVDCS